MVAALASSLEPLTDTNPAPTEARPPISTEPISRTELLARNIRETGGACYLYGSLTMFLGQGQHDIASFLEYLKQLLHDAGNPTDPIEVMLIEQLVLAHHNLGRLHVRAASAKDIQEHEVFNAAAARLTAEFRRTALAVGHYRQMSPKKDRSTSTSATMAANSGIESNGVARTLPITSRKHKGR